MPERELGCGYNELQERDLYMLTEFFKVLGNPTRIQILFLLMEQDACVSDLANRLGMTQSAVSHQLSLLKANKLVRQRRSGKMIFYTLVDDCVRMVIERAAKPRGEQRWAVAEHPRTDELAEPKVTTSTTL